MLGTLRGVLQLTRKPLLIAAMQAQQESDASAESAWPLVPASNDDLTVGQLLLGHVRRAESYGVFVGFAEQCVALASKANLSDQFVADPRDQFAIGQTVLCFVLSVDDAPSESKSEGRRVQLSLKPSQCMPLASPSLGACFVRSFFAEKRALERHALKSRPETVADASAVAFGARIRGCVDEIKAYGTILSLEGAQGMIGFAHAQQNGGAALGAQVEARVLDGMRLFNA